ncbi:MAG: cupin domain-containing protein [Actinomycetota bacterium]
MELVRSGETVRRKPPVPNTPTVDVLFGGDADSPDVGVVRVTVPVGAAMPEHDHGGSDVVLVPTAGAVEITQGPDTIHVGVGDAALVRKDERVALRNPGDVAAEVIVSAGPPVFVAGIRAWPEPARS